VGIFATFFNCLTECDVLIVVNEQRVGLVVFDYLIDGWEYKSSHAELTIRSWINVEMTYARGKNNSTVT